MAYHNISESVLIGRLFSVENSFSFPDTHFPSFQVLAQGKTHTALILGTIQCFNLEKA